MKKTSWMLALVAGCITWAAQAALAPGDTAPAFSAPASLAGKDSPYSLREALASGPAVVYFYPSAFTNGCNLQAHLFSENADRIRAAGASVIGVSLDSIERLHAFSADPQYCAGKVKVASDGDGRIAKSFGLAIRDAKPDKRDTRGNAIGHGSVERTTFVIDSSGKIAATISGLSAADNVAKTLEAIDALRASNPTR